MQFIKNRFLRVVVRLILSVIALLLLMVASLQIPFIQTLLVNKTSEYISEEIGYPIHIDAVDIGWFDKAEIEGIDLFDQNKNEFIHIDKAEIDFQLASFFNKKKIVIENISLIQPRVFLDWNKTAGVLNINTFTRAIKEAFQKKGGKYKKPKLRSFTILNFTIQNGFFSYHDNRKEHISHNGFDHNYFELDSIYASVDDFFVHYDTIQLQANGLKARERNIDYHVRNLTTLFRYTKKSLEFYEIDGQIEDSYISNEIVMKYDTIIDLTDFNHKVMIDAKLDGSTIYTKDLAAFAPAVRQFHDRWYLEGDFTGKVDDFKIKNFVMKFGNNSKINGFVNLEGLPNVEETYINVDLTKSKIDSRDLNNYLTKRNHYNVARKFGSVKFSSDFQGYPQSFVAHGKFDTEMGYLESDLKFEPKNGVNYYDGRIKTKEFNLRRFLNAKELGLVNMDGHVKGSGFGINDAVLTINGNFDRLDFNHYSYKRITADAKLQKGFISGEVNINDPYLTFNSKDINIDFREGKDSIRVNAIVKKCFPQKLHFTQDSSFFKGNIDIQTSGLDLDKLIGRANFDSVFIYNNGKLLDADHFTLSSTKKDSIRDFSIKSNFGDFTAVGDFNFKTILDDIKSLLKETNLIFVNDPKKTINYYANKISHNDHNYKINYELNIKNINPIISLFNPNIFISPNSNIIGDFKHGKNTIFNLYSEIDSLKFNDHAFKNNLIDVSFSKITDSTDVLASGTFKTDKYYNKTNYTTRDARFEALWLDDSLTFHLALKNPFNRDYADLNGNISFQEKEIIVSLFNSQLYLLNKSWAIQKGNEVRFGENINFKNLKVNHMSESVALKGTLSRDPEKLLFLSVRNFNLTSLDPITPIPFKGLFDGKIMLKDVYNNPTFFGDSRIKQLHLKDFHLGDLHGSFSWAKNTNIINSDIDLELNDIRLAHVSGSLNLDTKTYDFKGLFQETPLSVLEELLLGQATHITGKGYGEVKLTGTIDEPKFNGAIDIKGGGFTVEYLKTHYQFDDKVYFEDDKIVTKNIVLTDTLYNTQGKLSGYLKHRMFKNFETNILLSLDKTLAMNTTAEDNKKYYGTAFGTGDISIVGPFNHLKIESDELTSENGTKLYVPLEETEAISTKDYITFKRPDKKPKKSNDSKSQTSKMDIHLNFDVRDNAYFEIIFDKKAGDIIKGYGEGQLELKLDTKGDFNVYGTYQIKNGTYNFTMVNLINKRFYIDPGSVIKWNGNPYQGKLDVNAKYQLNTSLIPLVEDTAFIAKTPEAKRREPVDVKMFLRGPLLGPEITFGIEILDFTKYLEMEQAVNEFNTQIQYNEQFLNNQVFSLMVLKQFAPMQQQSGLNLGAAGGNSVSELFSNQFSSWVSQFDENLDIDIDLEAFDENTSSSFRLKLSYSILDGKIRVSRDGSFTNIDNQDQLANLFGEWTIEYLISNNGNLRMKAYNKTNQNNISTAIQNTSSQVYGVSLSHTASFDNLSELFRKNPNKIENENKEVPQETTQSDNNDTIQNSFGNKNRDFGELDSEDETPNTTTDNPENDFIKPEEEKPTESE